MAAPTQAAQIWNELQRKDLIEAFVHRRSQKTLDEAPEECKEDGYAEFISEWQREQGKVNLRLIHEVSESPLEIAFLTSLVICFQIRDPLNLVVEKAPRWDIERAITDRLADAEESFRLYLYYKNIPDYARPELFDDFLAWLVQGTSNPMPESEAEKHAGYAFYEFEHERHHAVRITLQPVFENFYGPGKGIRVDALCWVPSNPAVKVVIECDGFEHHSSKESFVSDRIRDRKLAEKGYHVRRYAGPEVYRDIPAVSKDLFDYLESTYSFGHKRADEWETEFRAKYAAEITPHDVIVDYWRKRLHGETTSEVV